MGAEPAPCQLRIKVDNVDLTSTLESGRTASSIAWPVMVRTNLKSNLSLIALFLPFLVVAVGGSGLHHAPIFGLHGCCHGHHNHATDDCGESPTCHCGHHPSTETAGLETPGFGNAEDPCSFCQFFASVQASVDLAVPRLFQSVSFVVPGQSPDVVKHLHAGFLARGPPAV